MLILANVCKGFMRYGQFSHYEDKGRKDDAVKRILERLNAIQFLDTFVFCVSYFAHHFSFAE